MVESVSGISLPLIFWDGEQETVVGKVFVYPGMDFKSFQTMMSRQIGISPHQFSIYLAGPTGLFTARRKTLITHKFDFSTVFRERSSVFLVVLKRSRRERRRAPPLVAHQQSPRFQPQNVTILRRENSGIDFLDRFGLPGLRDAYPMEELGRRIKNLEMERMRFLNNMAASDAGRIRLGGEINAPEGDVEVCEKCARGETEFHPCVRDPIIFGFRVSPFGPIAPPVKRPGTSPDTAQRSVQR